MIIIPYTTRKKFGILTIDCLGKPVQDRQHCTSSIKEARLIAREDLKMAPMGVGVIYTHNRYGETTKIEEIM